jgi:DNA polymerase alpha subunit B
MGVENNVPNIKRQKIEDTSSKVSKSTHTNSIDRTFKTSSQSFAERSGPGNQVVGYKQDKFSTRGDIELSDTRPLGLRCKIDWNLDDFNNINSRYRYMFTTIDERARALDKHLLRLQNHYCGVLQIPIEDLQPVGTSSQETVWVCGRICCDTAQGKLNDKSVQLEGCRRDGGRRVLLKLDQNLPYSLFPGQIVLAEGVCSTGREFVAKRVISNIPQPRLQVDPNDLLKFQYSKSFQGGAPLSLVVAVGPFTTSDNLEYEPLRVLLGKMLEDKPDVLVLVGPFVDASHPSIADGLAKLVNEDTNVEKILSYEMIFIKKIIMEGLEQLFVEEPDIPTNIILIPSLLDAHHEHVFPQAPFGDRDPVDTPFYEERLGTLDVPFSKDSDVRKRVHLLPNPCMFR